MLYGPYTSTIKLKYQLFLKPTFLHQPKLHDKKQVTTSQYTSSTSYTEMLTLLSIKSTSHKLRWVNAKADLNLSWTFVTYFLRISLSKHRNVIDYRNLPKITNPFTLNVYSALLSRVLHFQRAKQVMFSCYDWTFLRNKRQLFVKPALETYEMKFFVLCCCHHMGRLSVFGLCCPWLAGKQVRHRKVLVYDVQLSNCYVTCKISVRWSNF